jgi:hypothetical protein
MWASSAFRGSTSQTMTFAFWPEAFFATPFPHWP